MSEVVRVEGLSKLYRRLAPGFKLRTLKSALLERSLVGGLRPEEAIPAVSEVSFAVRRGEAFGLIGSNGSGKSTVLKLVAGILRPTAGVVTVDGRVSALIELGAGFHPEISGRENIFINGAVLGLSRRQVEARFDRIVDFAEVADFIDEPVKTYSSGMYVRLGFAVAVHTDPDVLLVDEVLAVGDESFAHRCLRRIEEFLAGGGTLLFVSHSLALVETLCDRVLWLEKGRMRELGEPRRVVDAYRHAVAVEEGLRHQLDKEAREMDPDAPAAAPPAGTAASAAPDLLRWGSRQAEIVGARLRVDGEERYHLASGEPVCFELEVRAEEPLQDFVFGIAVTTPRGTEVWGTNTDLEGWRPERLEGTARIAIEVPSLELAPGEYRIDLAVHSRDGAPYDYRRHLLALTVTAPVLSAGCYAPSHTWRFDGGVRWQEEAEAPARSRPLLGPPRAANPK
jgi:ABC-type polysaccharide/polyol phosphate transport system ATPase subunit